MAEIKNCYCESTGFTEVVLRQYGSYVGSPDKPQLPFLVEHVVVTYVTAGVGTIKLGNTPQAIAPGSVVVFFPGVCVNASALTEPVSAYWMEISGDACASVLLRAGLTPQKPVLTLPEDSKIAAAFARLADSEEEYSALRATGIAFELLDCLLSETSRPQQVKPENLQQYYVDKSIRYIETKYPQDISVEDVAQYCGLNRSYLGKLFRDTAGMTTQEYLIRHRMKIACSYLERAAAPIATIARSVGYPNQLHFSRAFHKVFGIPPREWQKRNRKVEK